MLKKMLIFCISLWVVQNAFADNIQATIEINGVVLNDGLVYVAVYSNENDYKKEVAFASFVLQPTNAVLIHSLELPEGEYVVSVFQDKNNDGKTNKIIFGIPTELIGITNYNLRGVPGNFNRLKMPVNIISTKLIVNMGRVRPIL